MRHAAIERWSRGESPLHRVDARAKLGALLVFLASLATMPAHFPASPAGVFPFVSYAGYFVLLLAAILAARLPVGAILARAALVLPFSAVFALAIWWSGDPRGALVLATKSFLSVLAALTLAATTPWVGLLDALAALRVPRVLLLVLQFVGRYFFVATDEAARMRFAAESRLGAGRRRGVSGRFQAAAGAVGTLFARSSARADGIYRAMLARGFTGIYSRPAVMRFQTRDGAFLCASIAATLVVRVAL